MSRYHEHTEDSPRRARRGRGRGFGPGFRGGFFGPGPRASRGDIRAAILALLAEQPMHGYQVIQEIAERSGGVWTPSPGSVYPTLQQLEDEGLVTVDTANAKKVFSLTDAGRAVNDEREHATPPWEEVGRDVNDGVFALRETVGQLMAAAAQIARSGNAEHVATAKQIIGDAKRSLYRILADDDA